MLDRNLERMAKIAYGGDEPTGYSPIYLVLEASRRYLAVACSHAEVIKSARRCALPLGDFADQLPAGHSLLEILDAILETLEELEGEPPGEVLVARLTRLEEQLVSHDLAGLHQQIEVREDQERLLRGLELGITEDDLTRGHYRILETELRRYFVLDEPIESLLERLELELTRIRASLSEYNSTYLDGDEWTVEVALADRYLIDGLSLWLVALGQLMEACLADDQEAAFACLQTLREGNRNFVLVDRLANRTRQAEGTEGE